MRYLATCIVFVLAAFTTQGKADTIADWTFEVSQPANAGSYLPEVGSGYAGGFHAGAAVYSSPNGNGSSHSFSSNAWAVGDHYQFLVSTVGYENIHVSFDQTSSNTGPRDFRLAYSTDGSAFTDRATYSVLANGSPYASWSSITPHSEYSFSFDLSSITALDVAPYVYFQLIDNSTTSAGGGTVGSAGTDRVDNFMVSGTAVLPGDANLDGTVNGADLNAVLSNYNQAGDWFHGNFNYDGMVNGADLNIVLSNYNQTVSVSAGTVVPEPGALVLLGTGVIGFLSCPWRRRKREK
jgi:hypothetical protein